MTIKPILAAFGALTMALTLAGCVSIGAGGKPPEQLYTLTSIATVAAGASVEGDVAGALAVTEPSVPHHLNVLRVPVQVNANSLAYLQDAVWVEKPARLFQRMLAETIRARGGRLVVGAGELEYAAQTALGGDLVAMDYDAARSRVIVRYDAMLRLPDGTVRTRRFESEQTGIPADATLVGPALNRAANDVAAQVADWVG